MGLKRVNFNMATECHTLLKGFCALNNISLSEHCYNLIAADFERACREDPRIRHLLISSDYPPRSKAQALKVRMIEEFGFE